MRRHERDESFEELEKEWAALQEKINAEVCSKMITTTDCDLFVSGELKGVYDSVRVAIEERIKNVEQYKN